MLITSPQSQEDFKRYYDLRWRILRMPWNQPKGSEKDELEEESFHIMVCETERIPIGIGRLHVNSKEEAVQAVKACKYPPEGIRGYGPRRSSYLDPDYVKTVNNELLIIVQIETKKALKNLEDIL